VFDQMSSGEAARSGDEYSHVFAPQMPDLSVGMPVVA
jgi:hypothetical protein